MGERDEMRGGRVTHWQDGAPDLSVIMPVYRPDFQFLEDAIASVLSQGASFELILVDDGNDLETASRLDSYGAEDGRIRIIRKENGGVSSARNCGLSVARGAYATFIDADDLFEPGALARGLCVARESNADIVFGGMEKVYTNGSSLVAAQNFPSSHWRSFCGKELLAVLGSVFNGRSLEGLGLVPVRYYSTCGTFYRLESLNGLRFNEDTVFCEDSIFNWSAVRGSTTVAFADGTWYRYRENTASATGRLRIDILHEMDPTANVFLDIREEVSGELRRNVDSGIYLYCLYRLYACSVLQPDFYSAFRCSKTAFVRKIILTPPYSSLFEVLEPCDSKAALMVSLARRRWAFPMTLLITQGNRMSNWVTHLTRFLRGRRRS